MLGKEKIQPCTREIPLRKLYHRTLVASKKIEIGEKFTKKNLSLMRVKNKKSYNLKPRDYFKIIGKYSKKSYKRNETI